MNKKLLFSAFCIIMLAACSMTASAFPASKYATRSRLATGKWVKIAIPEDGIYQITYEELTHMGIRNPQNVRIYGSGGHPISEILDGSAPDDLIPVPCKHFGNKVCFYGCGPLQYTLNTESSKPRFTRAINSYSTKGYYFITCDDGTSPVEPTNITGQITGDNVRTTSLEYSHHELELMSRSQSGKDMLGELMLNGEITLPYSLPDLCGDSSIIVNPCVAAKLDTISNIYAKVNGDAAIFTIGTNRIYASTSEYVFYNSTYPSAIFEPYEGEQIPATGNLTFGINLERAVLTWARLDYYIITYYHRNTIARVPFGQRRMAFGNVTTSDVIAISGANQSTQMWDVTDPSNPRNYILSTKDGVTGFTPTQATDKAQFIAFDPSKQLKSIDGFEPVQHQNIHGLSTPDMVIVTCEELLPQAERVAQMHRDHDNMIVHVIDQQQIFNEFSSGTPDAMAIRLMNKMFYDRNANKFKLLLMFGAGNQDNRQLFAKRDCTILTYESTTSNDENNSYVSDDFFGMLDDNSGRNPAAEMLRLGVGRIPCATLEEAESDVDKLINYVMNPDYGPWRNNVLYVADYVDGSEEGDMHAAQAEGISNIINNELKVEFMKNKVYVTQFPTDPITGILTEGRRSMSTLLESGQYFMTYVGHANGTALTKRVKLWTYNESCNAAYPHLPIITTACCDVARYDGSQRGLMEVMFHKPDGGAIAMVAATRSAYANGNDALNQAFVRALFCHNTKGYFPTIGEAYMLCKQSFGTTTAYNKMMFSLLGDPAIKANYPKPLFKVTTINNKTADNSNIYTGALQRITVVAKVLKPNSTEVDVSFNGDATLAIYDYLKKEQTYNGRDIYYPRKLLTQVNGRVVNGVFTGKTVIPRYTLYAGGTGLVSVYAHRDNSDEMVNGTFNKLVLNSYNESSSYTVHDTIPPSIDAIYFNDEDDFGHCDLVPPSSTLFIRATDDNAFNNQTLAIGNSMNLIIDGGKTSIPDVMTFASISDEGKTLTIQLPVNLDEGTHSLQYTVYDAAGNMSYRGLNFAVGSNDPITLSVEQEPAIDVATFHLSTKSHFIPDEVDIKLFDNKGSLKWKSTIQEFPFNWDLNTSSGRLPAGIYTFYGKYKEGTYYGGTNTGTLIIAEPHQIQ